MPFTLTMPKLSPTMEAGVIAKWHKKEGDFVDAGDLLLEVATDKATVEHNALDEGYLRKIIVQEKAEATVNQPIAIFTVEKNESIEGFMPEPEKPEVGVDLELEEEAEKKIERVHMGMEQPAFAPEAPLMAYTFERPTELITDRIKASPLAKKLAEDKGLDLSTITGSGPGGRIMERDLGKAQPSGTFVFGKREAPEEKPGSFEEISLTPMRKAISKRLQESKTFIPHFYVEQEIDASSLVQVKEELKNLEVKISYNDCVIRACSLALKQHPVINSGFFAANQSIVQFKTIDISVAVSVEDGLITPIIRHADYKNLGEIAVEIRDLATRAKQGKLEEHEYKGGSFTVSNLGMFGVTSFSGIINPPQAALLAVSGIRDVPVVKEGQVVPGKVMSLTLSADHRVIDGVAAAEFLQTLKKILENPISLLV